MYDPYQAQITLERVLRGEAKAVIEPDDSTRRWLELGAGLMIHFGINTFYDREWSDGTLDIKAFNPVDYDPEQWVCAAKAGGLKYLLFVTKHHDGFCNWHTQWTDCHCGNTPFKRDVLAELAQACAKHGIKLAYYYSLWDRYEPSFEHDRGYAMFMKRQLTELLVNYGEIAEIWFDGGWKKGGTDYQDPERWHWREIYEHIKAIQPHCMVGNNGTSGRSGEIVMWPCDFRIGEKKLPPENDKQIRYCGGVGSWLPFEAVFTLSAGGDGKPPFGSGKWFWHPTDITTVTPESLVEKAAVCRERNANILINAGPTDKGLLRDVDVKCLQKFGKLNKPAISDKPVAEKANPTDPDTAITA